MTDAQLVQACAEKVMGWRPGIKMRCEMLHPTLGHRDVQYRVVETQDEAQELYDSIKQEYTSRRLFFYSGAVRRLCTGWQTLSGVKTFSPLTSDADACAVLDHMKAQGWNYNIADDSDGVQCAFDRDTGEPWHGEAESPNRRRAIVLAALKAVGALP